jgi:ectoine hydroxylase-related dioxygenase (phytanoyl-CoA dioxygenase family)
MISFRREEARMNSPSSYGIRERATSDVVADRHAERVRLVGYTVVAGGFSPDHVRQISARIDALLERQASAAGGLDRLSEIGEHETARCCLAQDEAFLTLVTNGAVTDICRRLLGDYFVLMQQNAVVNPPGRAHTQNAYHRDLPYQHFVSSRPLAISALFCADAFTQQNGATVVIPGSHKVEQFPSEAAMQDLELPVEAPAGSYIVFDSMLFHRAGTNTSAAVRRAVNQVYAMPFVAQQISLPDVLGGKYSDEPELARLLGYGATPVRSVEEWWARRRARKAR